MSFYLTNSSQLSMFISFLVMCLLRSLHPSRVSNHFPLFVVLSRGSRIRQFLLSLSYLVSPSPPYQNITGYMLKQPGKPSLHFCTLGGAPCMYVAPYVGSPSCLLIQDVLELFWPIIHAHTNTYIQDARQKIVLRND